MSYSWSSNQASGNSRQINGNVYGNVTFGGDHYHGSESIPDLRGSVMTSLYFNEMQNYRSRELSMSPGTFEWIFDPKRTTFTDWLQSNSTLSSEEENEEETTAKSRVFWVHGKAGSGKSTLMKFMAEHKRTREILSRGEKYKVIVATFFAWNAGAELEKTLLRLLRSLVHQLLAICPELLEYACPSRFGDDVESPGTKPWSREELFRAIRIITTSDQGNLQFAIFVDGIDEMTEQSQDIIDALDLVSQSWTVKLCVSGRPWNPFKNVYGGRGSPHQLCVQDHSEQDIRAYVSAQLSDNFAYIRGARIGDRDLQELCNRIILEADGVFFWVVLTVKSMRRGLSEGDDFEMLNERLEHFPKEIQALIAHVFDECIDPAYRKYTARTLLLLASGKKPLFHLWFLDKPASRFRSVCDALGRPITGARLGEHLDEAEVAVNKWCRELVTVTRVLPLHERYSDHETSGAIFWFEVTQSSVSFSHRCVKEFIDERRSLLQTSAGSEYHPELTELKISVNLLDLDTHDRPADRFPEILHTPAVRQLFSNLHEATSQMQQEAIALLQEAGKCWERRYEGTWEPRDAWPSVGLGTVWLTFQRLMPEGTPLRPDFLSYLLN
ncbi:hypothetical protein HII31_10190 [Pseudocercospora fuligena]|uniref:Nephrocystin 3-like N-terminal domain-containing protein n=1 Tax=Pseudocercospora fuligena TaxID=685502 RepID=A0A8H6RCK1_9PEZI|nr:hypothetical protein HII31_10190 [Pseudocercospora fuligena]